MVAGDIVINAENLQIRSAESSSTSSTNNYLKIRSSVNITKAYNITIYTYYYDGPLCH